MSSEPGPLDLAFTATIGVTVKGDLWPCVAVPGSVGILGTGKAVKVAVTVDGEPLTAGLLPTGIGGHMLSISAKLRKRLGKDLGDQVDVRITERLT
ncbi:DUF1905 domain-containing protein [Clavibacter michiganensis]|nr:DUF1905 domain-containing protein [Clavibacter michiganensis]